MTRHAESLARSIGHLDWFKIPHTLDQVIGVYAEATSELAGTTARTRTNDQMVDGIKASAAEGRGAKGGHSDPTPAAALRGEPDAVDDDVTVGSIDAALDLLSESVLEVATALGIRVPPPGRLGRQSRITDASTNLHRITPDLHVVDHQLDAKHLDFVIRTAIGETAEWLHVKAEAIWDAAKADARPAQTRTHAECSNCVTHGITGTTATVDGMCGHCSRFQSDHKCLPDQRICRAWDRGAKSIPNGWVMEAQAASRVKPGRSRAS